MKRSFLAVLALSLSVFGCGGSDDDASTASVSLDGVYRPADQGAVASITFSNGKDYLLVPRGCTGGACAEIGTYRIDTNASALLLDDAKSGATRSMPLEIVKTSNGGGSSLVQALHTLDLVDPGAQLNKPGGQQVTGNGTQQVSGSQQVTGVIQQLLQLVQQMIMAGQQMNRDNGQQNQGQQNDNGQQGNNGNNDAKKDPLNCGVGVPTKDTPAAEALAYFARCPGGP